MEQQNKSKRKEADCKRCVYNNFARCGVCFCMLPRCRYLHLRNTEKGDAFYGKNI